MTARHRAVYLHAGAHRTGSSSFQHMLGENRAALAQAGYALAYPGRDGAPGGDLRLRLPRPNMGCEARAALVPRARAQLQRAQLQTGAAHLILSEENILGRMIHFYDGAFYPAAGARLGVLAEALGPGRVAGVLIVVRDYAGLFASAYRRRARDRPVRPFAEFRGRMLDVPGGWPLVIEQIRDALRPDMLIVRPFSARGRSVDLLGDLVPGARGLGLCEPERAVNQSLDDAALCARQRRMGRMDHGAGGFAEFTPEQRAHLDARYAEDLERISAMTCARMVA